MKKRLFIMNILLLLVFSYFNYNSKICSAKKVKFNKNNVSIKVGDKVKLKLLNAAGKTKWKISNKKLIKVKKKNKKYIIIKGIKEGTAKIKAVNQKKTYTAKIIIKANQQADSSTTPPAAQIPAQPTSIAAVTTPGVVSFYVTDVKTTKDRLEITTKLGNGLANTIVGIAYVQLEISKDGQWVEIKSDSMAYAEVALLSFPNSLREQKYVFKAPTEEFVPGIYRISSYYLNEQTGNAEIPISYVFNVDSVETSLS